MSVSEPFRFLTPFVNGFFNDTFSMGASATAGVLGYAAPGGGAPPGPCAAPIADFSVTVTSGNSIFADPTASTPNSGVCNISGYTWVWGDGKNDVGTATGDPHTYGAPGTYSITLSVTNQGGSATRTRNVTVPVGPPPPTCKAPTASFTFVKNGKKYSFTDTSTVSDPVELPDQRLGLGLRRRRARQRPEPTPHVHQQQQPHRDPGRDQRRRSVGAVLPCAVRAR